MLRIEAQAVLDLVDTIDDAFAEACRMILACKGRVVVSGMGKSGHVARKIAATLASTGTPAFFVHPAEASHGDLGMITSEDVFVALSNSGQTEELTAIVPLESDFAAALLEITRKRMGMVAIVDDDLRVQGIFTDGDLRRVLGRAGSLDPSRLKVRDVMTASPVSIAPDALAVEAVRIMEERKIGQILVADADKVLLGALHFHDLLVAKVV